MKRKESVHKRYAKETSIAIQWEQAPPEVRFDVLDGELAGLELVQGAGPCEGEVLRFPSGGPARVHLDCRRTRLAPGSPTTKITVWAGADSFSFLARDVTSASPIVLPASGVAVTPAEDVRSYTEILAAVRARGGRAMLDRMAAALEETAAAAARGTRRIYCPTYLGIGRDMRWFQIDTLTDNRSSNRMEATLRCTPHLASPPVRIPETDYHPLVYNLYLSRGEGCVLKQTRRLEDGSLPILHVRVDDGEQEIRYDSTLFCALETKLLSATAVRGTHYLAADGLSGGHMFTPEQAASFKLRLAEESAGRAEETLGFLDALRRPDGSQADGHAFSADERRDFIARAAQAEPEEEVVLVLRVRMRNLARAPRHAWLRLPAPGMGSWGGWNHDPETGCARFDSGRVFCVARLNGAPFPNPEIALLLQPGETAWAEFIVPHRPLPVQRALRLFQLTPEKRQRAARHYWRAKLASGARLELPERRIQEMWQAGLLHLDLVMYGQEPDGVLAPSCGSKYPALGPESVAMIQFMDSMGRHAVARRCLEYFLEKQRPDGSMFNYGNHGMDVGFVLWTLAEHYAYTRDDAWLRARAAKAIKGCRYLLAWRERNRREDLRGRGYGLIEGQTADMREVFHGFKLNASALHGLESAVGLLRRVLPEVAEELRSAAAAWREDLRAAVLDALGRAPAVPLGDGTWTASLPPWPELDRPACLDNSRPAWTHGTFMTRDNTTASNLIFHGLFTPDDPLAERLIRYETDLYHVRNVRHSQPYVSRHPWVHLQRGETQAFLKAYYNGLMSLADRETYSFWEHYHGTCPHKTESESGFLMQTRWMLWLEMGNRLALLPGIPRAWMQKGKVIRLHQVASHFGPVSLEVKSGTDRGILHAAYRLEDAARRPALLTVRLPHPRRQTPGRVEGGAYDAATETVTVRNPPAEGTIVLAP